MNQFDNKIKFEWRKRNEYNYYALNSVELDLQIVFEFHVMCTT